MASVLDTIWTVKGDGRTVPPGEVVRPHERLHMPNMLGLGAQHILAMFGATVTSRAGVVTVVVLCWTVVVLVCTLGVVALATVAWPLTPAAAAQVRSRLNSMALTAAREHVRLRQPALVLVGGDLDGPGAVDGQLHRVVHVDGVFEGRGGQPRHVGHRSRCARGRDWARRTR